MAELLRSESFPPVSGLTFIDADDHGAPSGVSEIAHAHNFWEDCDAPLTTSCASYSHALRPGAARFTCSGAMLREDGQMEPCLPQQLFVSCDNGSLPVGAAVGPAESSQTSAAPPAGKSFTSRDVVSPFGALAGQLPTDGAEAGHREAGQENIWAAATFTPMPCCGDFGAQNSFLKPVEVLTFELPAPFARRTMDGWPALPKGTAGEACFKFINLPCVQQQPRTQQEPAKRASSTFCEPRNVELWLQDDSGDCDSSGEVARNDVPCSAFGVMQQSRADRAAPVSPCEEPSFGQEQEPSAAPVMSSQPSIDCASGVSQRPGPANQPESEAASVTCNTDADTLDEAAVKTRRRRRAPAASVGVPRPTARRGKRRAAEAAAAVVVKAARDDNNDDDDEDYVGQDCLGAGVRPRAPKRGRKGGATRPYTGKARGDVTCRNCGATQTPQWRCGPEGLRTLCNACGVRFMKGKPLDCPKRVPKRAEHKKRQMGL